MSGTTLTISVRNSSGAWEVIDREPWYMAFGPDDVVVEAKEIGGEVGQPLLVQLHDDEDGTVLNAIEIEAS